MFVCLIVCLFVCLFVFGLFVLVVGFFRATATYLTRSFPGDTTNLKTKFSMAEWLRPYYCIRVLLFLIMALPLVIERSAKPDYSLLDIFLRFRSETWTRIRVDDRGCAGEGASSAMLVRAWSGGVWLSHPRLRGDGACRRLCALRHGTVNPEYFVCILFWWGLSPPLRITSWYPNFNGSHFGLPPSEIHNMTGLPPKIVWTMTYSHRPH